MLQCYAQHTPDGNSQPKNVWRDIRVSIGACANVMPRYPARHHLLPRYPEFVRAALPSTAKGGIMVTLYRHLVDSSSLRFVVSWFRNLPLPEPRRMALRRYVSYPADLASQFSSIPRFLVSSFPNLPPSNHAAPPSTATGGIMVTSYRHLVDSSSRRFVVSSFRNLPPPEPRRMALRRYGSFPCNLVFPDHRFLVSSFHGFETSRPQATVQGPCTATCGILVTWCRPSPRFLD